MPESAGSTQIGYEIPNALGALWAVCPKLAAKCVRLGNYAKAVQTYLRAVDLYCYQQGVAPGRVEVETIRRSDRIVQVISHR